MRPSRLLSGLNRFSLVVAGIALAALLVFLVVATLFYEATNGRYLAFLQWATWPSIPILAVTALSQVLSRVVHRVGFFYVAVFIAVLPVMAIAMGAAYLAE